MGFEPTTMTRPAARDEPFDPRPAPSEAGRSRHYFEPIMAALPPASDIPHTPIERPGLAEHVLEEVQRRRDENPQAMRRRRETVEHPFGTIKARMGATHFLMKRLKNVRTEMALSVLAYNLTRVMNIMGIAPLMAAMRA